MTARLAIGVVTVVLTLHIAQPADAQTVTARSCSQADVQAAVNGAVAGATVAIPVGRCTWSSAITVTKKLTISGAGSTGTVIVVSPAGFALSLGRTGSRVTGIGFVDATVAADGSGWRVDHNSFSSDAFRVAVHANGANSTQDFPTGLIDHNEFTNMRVLTFGGDLMANPEWFLPYTPGSGDAVYVEDNTFEFTVFGNVIDCNYGGRFVFRYNNVTDSYIETHSVQGGNRACRSWEIYNNTISQSKRTLFAPFFLRGGTGVVFNNVVTGAFSSLAITIDNVRNFQGTVPSGKCDGTSPWDGNEESNGYPCRDQIGRSDDLAAWTTTSPYPKQKLAPLYVWNNAHGATMLGVVTANGSGIHIKQGRDYFTGIQKPGYTPYTYPHPGNFSSSNSGTVAPGAPKNLKVVP